MPQMSKFYACLEQVNLAQFVRDNGGLDMQLLSRGHIFAQRTFKHVTAMAHQKRLFHKTNDDQSLEFLGR